MIEQLIDLEDSCRAAWDAVPKGSDAAQSVQKLADLEKCLRDCVNVFLGMLPEKQITLRIDA